MNESDYCLICGKSFEYCSKSKSSPNYCKQCAEKRIKESQTTLNMAEELWTNHTKKFGWKKIKKKETQNYLKKNLVNKSVITKKICVHCEMDIQASFLEINPKTVVCIKCFNQSFTSQKRCLSCAIPIDYRRLEKNPEAIRCTKCESEIENELKRLRIKKLNER